MNKWYFGLPLIALLAFGLFFWSWARAYEQKKLDEKEREHKEFIENQRLEQIKQAKAIEENNKIVAANNEKLKREREADAAAKEKREKDQERYAKLSEDLRRLSTKLAVVNKDIDAEKDLIDRANEEKASLEAERAFLATYVRLAENNGSRLLALVDKVDKAAAAVKKQLDEIKAAEAAKKQPAR
jgi:hypothetical protein